MSLRSCPRCLSQTRPPKTSPYRAIGIWNAAFHSSRSLGSAQSEQSGPAAKSDVSPNASDLAAAKARAWYLPQPNSSAGSSSTRQHRNPVFTTFDPSRTTSDTSTRNIRPLPSNSPPHLKPLHTFLTTHHQAIEVLDPTSVTFLHTPSSSVQKSQPELITTPEQVGSWVDWVVVVTVKGVGKNVIGRAERVIRLWLHNNPVGKPALAEEERIKTPRTPEDTDWSLIALPDQGICINLFTEEGREHWDLEALWGLEGRKESSSVGVYEGAAW